MPGGDRTGPQGMGPMTGRGAGFCANYGTPGSGNPGFRQGFSFGAGGRGRRNRVFAPRLPGWRWLAGAAGPGRRAYPLREEAPQSEWEALQEQARYLEDCLKDIQARMENLAPGNKPE